LRYASHRRTRIVPNKFGPYAQRPMESTIISYRSRQRTAVSRLRIGLTYYWRHGRWPDIDNPQTFTEHVQHCKLFDHDIRMPQLADKVLAKQIVADRLGPEWIIPTLWHGNILPEKLLWPAPFVVKSRHGCNQTAFVWHEQTNWDAIRRKAKRWMSQQYGVWLDEWIYSRIERGILVEPFVGEGRTPPVDYKFYVFCGRVQFVQVHLGRGGRHRWILFDRDWRRVSAVTNDADPQAPQNLPQMIEAAEVLGTGFDFVRVDLYEVGGRPLFGEISFYPGSGLDPFDPVSLDLVIGRHWTEAKAQRLK
jgi:hypothetical protein